ncbi:MAG TPA: hypothetical protein VHF23_01985 [Gaiellaceae bacterium]|nr:hypothetical protein [Gaiellaceae bacterium]
MVETFTPAVCGSRTRQRLAAAIFTLAAVASAALLGAALALVGAVVGAGRAVPVAAALALLAAAREAGLLRLPLPQSRRQVPERWRFELPLPLWAGGYGAGLGAGFLTYQPVSTFWVACASALALARPLPAALCFALFGAGRALTLVWPRRRGTDAVEAVERLAARRPALLRANVAGLAACAVLLGVAPVAHGAIVAAGLDPSVSLGNLAWARQDGSVLVRSNGVDTLFPAASAPSLDGGLLAYVDGDGIRVVRWRTGDQVARIGGNASRPSLEWPRIAYRTDYDRTRRIVLRNLETGRRRTLVRAYRPTDLGRPSLRAGRVAWHASNRAVSRITLLTISTGTRRNVARSKVALLRHPALTGKRILWTDERSGRAWLRLQRISGGRVRTLGRMRTREVGYWTTALTRRAAYATRWSLRTGRATVYRYGL